MRAHLLTTLSPVLLLLAAACGPTDTADTADTASTEAAAPPASEAPAATETAEAPAPAAAPAADEPAAAENEEAMAAVGLRQAPMKLLSFNFGPMRGMLQGNAEFNAETVGTNASRIALIAGMIPGVFEANPDTTSIETAALPAVWTAKADFDMKAMELQTAAEAVVAAAAGGDQAATMAAVGAMGMTCGGCHDDFRAQ